MADDDADDSYDFTDSALIGHAVSIQLAAKLLDKGIISVADAEDVLDAALLMLERWQSVFPEHRPGFEVARMHLSELLDGFRAKMKKPRE
jgi:hypothetical protein